MVSLPPRQRAQIGTASKAGQVQRSPRRDSAQGSHLWLRLGTLAAIGLYDLALSGGSMASGFHGGSRSLQDRFDTRALADRIDGLLVSDTISEGDRAFIEDRDMFFLATADAEGRPTCSYKGGEPGFCLLYTSPSPRDGLLSRM